MSQSDQNLFIVFALLEFDFVLAGEPSESRADLLLLQFGDLFDLLDVEYVGLIECIPDQTYNIRWFQCSSFLNFCYGKKCIISSYALQSYKKCLKYCLLHTTNMHCERFARHSHAIPAVDCSVYGTYRSGQHHCSACQLPSYIRGSALRIGMPRLTARRASALASSGL